jgi:hypothetical protein
VKLCSDLGLKESQEYILKLKKAEKMLETKKQVTQLPIILMTLYHMHFPQREVSGGSRKSSGGSVKAKRRETLHPGGAEQHAERVVSGGSGKLSRPLNYICIYPGPDMQSLSL